MLLFLIPTLIIVIYFVFRETDLRGLIGKINGKNLFFLAVTMFVIWLLNALRFFLVVRSAKGNISFSKAFEISMASVFASNITPFYSGGIATQVYFLMKFAQTIGRSMAISVIYLILSLFVTVTFSLILVLTPHAFISGIRSGFIYVLASFVLVLSFVALFFMRYPNKAKGAINLFFKVFVRRPADPVKLEKGINEFSESLRLFFSQNKLFIAFTILVALLTQLLSVFLTPLSLMTINVGFPLREAMLAHIAVSFVMSVGFTPGGIGLVEGAYAGMMYPFAPGSIAQLTFLYRIVSFYIPTIVGVIFFYKLLREERIRTAVS